MKTRRKHCVTFYSPGTLFSEQTTRSIDSWDTAAACEMSQAITERYGAKPYAFAFSTRIVSDDVDDGEGGSLRVEPKEVDRSGMYYMHAVVRCYDEVVTKDDPSEKILRGNMWHSMPFIVDCLNGYRSCHPFDERDAVVDAGGNVIERGDSPERMAYRNTFGARCRSREIPYPS